MYLKSSVLAAMTFLAISCISSAAPALSPTADKAPAHGHTSDPDYMALFFKNWDFYGGADEETAIQSGLAWPGQGAWSTCYQIVPDWKGQNVGSIKLSPAAQGCWFYPEGNTNCAGTQSGVDFWPIDAAGPKSVGQESDFGRPVGSWICIPWSD